MIPKMARSKGTEVNKTSKGNIAFIKGHSNILACQEQVIHMTFSVCTTVSVEWVISLCFHE